MSSNAIFTLMDLVVAVARKFTTKNALAFLCQKMQLGVAHGITAVSAPVAQLLCAATALPASVETTLRKFALRSAQHHLQLLVVIQQVLLPLCRHLFSLPRFLLHVLHALLIWLLLR